MNVVYIFFNRPDKVARSFQAVRHARPRQLYLVCDGPRQGRDDDRDHVARCQEIVRSLIDWDCHVTEDYSDVNLGCGRRVGSGISNALDVLGEAVILEDDCIPHETFFPFCQTMLDRYRDDSRVMSITGNNFQQGVTRGSGSYYFSKYPHIWGWATWRRAWNHFDPQIQFWPEFRDSRMLRAVCSTEAEVRYWTAIFDAFHAGKIDTWDYPWLLCFWSQNGLAVTPNVNLVSNVGFGPDATHTSEATAQSCMPTSPIGGDLQPLGVLADVEADEFVTETVFGIRQQSNAGFRKRVRGLLRRVKHRMRGRRVG